MKHETAVIVALLGYALLAACVLFPFWWATMEALGLGGIVKVPFWAVTKWIYDMMPESFRSKYDLDLDFRGTLEFLAAFLIAAYAITGLPLISIFVFIFVLG